MALGYHYRWLFLKYFHLGAFSMKKLAFVLLMSVTSFSTSYSHFSDKNSSDTAVDVPEVQKAVDGLFSAQLIDSAIVLAQKSQAPIKDFLRSCIKLSKLSNEQLIALKRDMQRLIQVTQEIDELKKAIDAKSRELFIKLVQQELSQELKQEKCTLSGGMLSVRDPAISIKVEKVQSQIKSELQKDKLYIDYDVLNTEMAALQDKVAHFYGIIQQAVIQKIVDLNGEFTMIRDVLTGALLAGISETAGQAIDECINEAASK